MNQHSAESSTKSYVVPLIIRGNVITDDLIPFDTRRGECTILTPDTQKHLSQLTLSDPSKMGDLYEISLDEIVDFLNELGHRLAPDENEHIARALEMNMLSGSHSREMLHGMYEGMRKALFRENVNAVIDHNVGREYLEGWSERVLQDRKVSVRAFGARTVHINAGNGPPISMYGTLNGAILRSDNIVKIPSNDPFTATAVALTMIDMAPEHPITRHMSVAYWKGGDARVESELYKPANIEKIVAWGGAASMGAIRKYLVPGIDLVALDPKLSISIIGKDAFATAEKTAEAASRLAMDIGAFNQSGCVSSRTVFVESGTGEDGITRLNDFGKAVFDNMQALPAHLSGHHPAFDPVLREELDGIRFSDAFRLIGGKGSEGAIIVSQEDEQVDFSDRLSCRVANLVPLDDVQNVARWVTLDTQTVGVYPDHLKKMLRDDLSLRGVQRFTSLGCAVFAGMANPHDSLELTRRMARWIIDEKFDEDVIDHGAGMCIAG
ncbi:Acyl-CoA reductase (LuxC) [Sphingobium faniae]|nr:Acyl-CoA reductase (LuxC) [Sphingobium faniae]